MEKVLFVLGVIGTAFVALFDALLLTIAFNGKIEKRTRKTAFLVCAIHVVLLILAWI